ncbi:MAG: hypothetical protein HWN68_09685 [Desulfobacterales bacterium]|nr:hypothetical protein [Desulfobacterales bacterium]
MKSTEIMFFCVLYLLFFFMLGSLSGIAAFPPPPQFVGFDLWGQEVGFYLSFWDMALVTGIIITVVGLSLLAGIKVFGSGITFDQSFVVTLAVALFFGGLLAWTMNCMLIDVPIYVSAVLIWPFIGALMYSIVSMARGGGG